MIETVKVVGASGRVGSAVSARLRERGLRLQEDDAELGQERGALAGCQNREPVRADREAGQQVAEDGRKPDPLDKADGAGGGNDDDQALGQQRVRQGGQSPAGVLIPIGCRCASWAMA